ncbi:MAG: hypothetical protein E3J72_01455 [Planctomycetota bacterium]|nr:MAG: hypothetical protein E3J72_01455 [Planctomycetota bacterium]
MSSKLEKLSRDIVFILGYKEENRKTHDAAWQRYLPEFFYTPTYIYLDSEGYPLFQDISDRQMHRMVSERELLSTLKKLLKKNGKGAPRRNWKKVRKGLREAEETLESDGTDKAVKALDKIIRKNAVPVLTERARSMRMEMLDNKFLAAEKERLAGVKPEPEDSVEYESDTIYRHAVADALEGNIIKARDALAFFLDADEERDKYKNMLELKKRLAAQCKDAFTAGRMRAKAISFVGTDKRLFEIGALLESELPLVDEMTVQFWALTDKGSVYAGYRTYKNVKKGMHHMVAAYIVYSDLRKTGEWERNEYVADMRVEIYVSNELVASGVHSGKPGTGWWSNADVRPLTFYHESGWGWDSGTMTPVRDGLVYGRPDIKKKSDK